MLTLFTTCAPFRGHRKVIQTNALRSWTLLRPRPEILLFGDEEGTAEIAQELGIRHIPQVERNEYGTPLISDIFAQAQALASNPILCYCNADIMLANNFTGAVDRVARLYSQFLLTGRRLGVKVDSLLDFSNPQWEQTLMEQVVRSKQVTLWAAIDYIVFPRGLFPSVPPMAVARSWWLAWLVYQARAWRVPVIDASPVVSAFHQDHPYSHPLGIQLIWNGPEAQRNLEVSGGADRHFTLADATHILTPKGVKPALGVRHLWRRFYTLPVFHPRLRPLFIPLRLLLKASRPIRIRVGLELTGYTPIWKRGETTRRGP